MTKLWMILGSSIFISCGSIEFLKPVKEKTEQTDSNLGHKTAPELDENILKKVVRNFASVLVGEVNASEELEIKYSDKLFNHWVHYYTKRSKARFMRHLKNADLYHDTVEAILEEEGLPKDLFFVGLIESGFNTKIRSHANAVGPWQFIRGTAKRYGLKVNRSIDERRNIHKATLAAANYFKDLYNIFGSWELALCAYNAGEYRIINAIRKGNTRDYRELVRKKLIPRETIYYVPKVAAARYLYSNRSKYGLGRKTNRGKHFTNADLVSIRGRHSRQKLAKTLSIPLGIFNDLNPDWKWRTVNFRSGMNIVVPRNKAYALKNIPISPRKRSNGPIHRVRRGDNLTRIARRYNMSLSELRSLNRLKGDRIFKGQKLRVRQSRNPKVYTVRRGDNLYFIARKFNTSISRIVRANSLRSTKIYSGQKIEIPSS